MVGKQGEQKVTSSGDGSARSGVQGFYRTGIPCPPAQTSNLRAKQGERTATKSVFLRKLSSSLDFSRTAQGPIGGRHPARRTAEK